MSYTTGVRGTGITFDGVDDYITLGVLQNYMNNDRGSFGAWIKPTGGVTATTNYYQGQHIMGDNSGNAFLVRANVGGLDRICAGNLDTNYDVVCTPYNVDEWTHIAWVHTAQGMLYLYKNGQLAGSTASGNTGTVTQTVRIGNRNNVAGEGSFKGVIDEPFFLIQARHLQNYQEEMGPVIKRMYETGYKALQSHGTNLGGGSADTNQQLGGTANTIGAVMPDWNNQYLYIGTNSTTTGALSKIDLSSDTNVKTYTSSANVPAGGATLLDEDVNSLAVGYNLEAVGSAASGIKTMGWDGYATRTSGDFVGETYALPKNIGSAVLWVSPVLDTSDISNTIVVKASNNGGSTYSTCTLINTDSNPTIAEREYACNFTTSDNDLKVKFEFTRGSTKTNTYITQYGISWLGESGFKIEQTDDNTLRLYNYTGETRELRLDVIAGASNSNSGTISLAPLAADVDTQNNANSIWVNKTGTSGSLLKLQTNGSDILNLTSSGVLTLTGSFSSTGNINSSSGSIQTNGITRIDNSGNATLANTTTTNLILSGQSGAPTSPSEGQIYFNSTDKESYIYKNGQWTKVNTDDSGSCPTGYILVPGSAEFGTEDFCVMKYEAKRGTNMEAISVAGTSPWGNTDFYNAKEACAKGGGHMLTNAEWMTIARNIEATTINDLDDDAGIQLATGHSDNAPSAAAVTTVGADPIIAGCNLSTTLENAANAYSAGSCEIRGDGSYAGDDNDKGYYGTSQAWSTTGYSAGAANKSQLRTHILSNGSIIWDFAGNMHEFIDMQCTSINQAYTWNTTAGPLEWTNAGLTDYEKYIGGPTGSITSTNGAGQYYGCTGTGNVAERGGSFNSTTASGIYTLALGVTVTSSGSNDGFRCALNN